MIEESFSAIIMFALRVCLTSDKKYQSTDVENNETQIQSTSTRGTFLRKQFESAELPVLVCNKRTTSFRQPSDKTETRFSMNKDQTTYVFTFNNSSCLTFVQSETPLTHRWNNCYTDTSLSIGSIYRLLDR